MRIKDECPLCDSKCCTHWASVSLFLKERMFEGHVPRGCKLHYCESCDFYFFNIRPDDVEMQRLYKGYRGVEYQRQREKYEFKYTAEFNASLGRNPVEVNNRIEILESVLLANDISSNIDVLDFGGNEGRLIPASLTGRKFCHDLSDNITVSGVIKLTKCELPQYSYGLVMLQHVLEHVSDPVEFLRVNIANIMDGESCLYIELPYELDIIRPFLEKNRKSFMFLKNRFKLYRPNWLLPTLPFTSAPVFHEHINLFTLNSLTTLLTAAGLGEIESQILEIDTGWRKSKIIYCLAKKTISS